MMSLRFLAIALLAVFTTPLAVCVGIGDYTYRLSDYSRLLAERQELVLSLEEIRGREDDLKALRALRPPEPLSSLVRGLDSVLPVYWDFSPSGIESGPTVIRNKYAAIATDRRKPPSIADLPAFAPPRGDAVAAAARSLPALGLLVLYTGLFITGSFSAFSRYDVR